MQLVKRILILEYSLSFEISSDIRTKFTQSSLLLNLDILIAAFTLKRSEIQEKILALSVLKEGLKVSITLQGAWYSAEDCGFIKSLLSFNQTRYDDASITLLIIALFYSFLPL